MHSLSLQTRDKAYIVYAECFTEAYQLLVQCSALLHTLASKGCDLRVAQPRRMYDM